MAEVAEIFLPEKINARNLAQELIDASDITDTKYFGGDKSGEVVRVDGNGRPYARMFSLRTRQEADQTVVHITDGDYCASRMLAKRQQVH